jgi:hypothetical protein
MECFKGTSRRESQVEHGARRVLEEEKMMHVKVRYPEGWRIATSKPWIPSLATKIRDELRRYGIPAQVTFA